MIYWFRKKIIQIAKNIPFFLVMVVLISYIENESSLYYGIYDEFYNGQITLSQPISYYIGMYFQYDILTIITLYALSFGLELCWRNKLCIHYLTFNFILRTCIEYIDFNILFLHLLFILNIVMCSSILTINIFGYLKKKNERK